MYRRSAEPDPRYLTPHPDEQPLNEYNSVAPPAGNWAENDDDAYAGDAQYDLPDQGKTEEFERFMSTSIRAFDAMMDAVKGGDNSLPPSRSGSRPTSRPGSRPASRPSSRPASRPVSPSRFPQQFSGLADSDSVAIVGNEQMVSQVARVFAQYGEQGDREEHSNRQAEMVDKDALEWHKARIAYLEGVRADLARQLESERLARRTEVDQLEDKAHQQLRAAQALLSREREQREQAEQVVREEMAEEMAAANRAAIDALDRADEVTARCRSLESKIEAMEVERASLVADRDGAQALLDAQKADVARLEGTVSQLMFNERMGGGVRATTALVKSKERVRTASAFNAWHHWAATDRTCRRFLVAGGCRQSANALRRQRGKSMRCAFAKWRGHSSQERWNAERQGIVAERAAAAVALDQAKKQHSLERAAKVVKSMQTGALTKGWRTWMKHVEKVKHHEEALKQQQQNAVRVMTKTIQRMLNAQMSAGFRVWIRMVQKEKEAEATQAADGERSKLLFSRALTVVCGAVSLSLKDKLRWGLYGLQQAVARRRDAGRKLKMFVKILMGQAVASWRRALNTWVKAIAAEKHLEKEQKRAAHLMTKTMLRMINAQMSAGFRVWDQLCTSERRAERELKEAKERAADIMIRTMKRMLIVQLSSGFHVWLKRFNAAKDAERALELEKKRAAQLMKQTMQRMLHAQLNAGMRVWCAVINAMKEKEALKGLQKSAAQVMTKTMQRMLNAQLNAGFRVWDTALRMLKAAEQLERERERAVKRVCRVIFAGEDKGKAKSFVKWHKYCSAHRAAEEAEKAAQRSSILLMTQTMSRMLQAQLFAGWQKWCNIYHAEQAREAAALIEKERQERVLKQVCRLVFSREDKFSVKAFMKWLKYCSAHRAAEESATQKRAEAEALARSAQAHGFSLISRVMGRMLNAKMFFSFRAWVGVLRYEAAEVLEKERFQRAVKQVCRVIFSGEDKGKAKSFVKWCKYSSAHRAVERAAKVAQQNAIVLMTKTMSRMLFVQLNAGFRAWVAWINTLKAQALENERQARAVKQVCRVIFSGEDKGRAKSFVKWYKYCNAHRAAEDAIKAAQRSSMQLMDRTMSRMLHVQLGTAYKQWAKQCRLDMEAEAAAALLAQRQERAVKQVCRVIFSGKDKGRAKSFVKWGKYCNAHRAAEERAAADRREAEAIFKAAQKSAFKLMDKTMSRMLHVQLGSGFHAWLAALKAQDAAAAAAALEKERFARAVKQVCNVVFSGEDKDRAKSFMKWSKYCHAHRMAEEAEKVAQQSAFKLMDKTMSRMLHVLLNAGFSAWASQVRAEKAAEQMAREQERAVKQVCRVIFSGEDKGKAKSFVKWYKYCYAHREAEILSTLRSREEAAMAKGAQRRALELMTSTMKRMLHVQLGSGFHAWLAALKARDVAAAAAALEKERFARAVKQVCNVVFSGEDKGKAKSFMKWSKYCHAHRMAEEAEKVAQQSAFKLMDKTMSRMLHVLLNAGFSAWASQVRAEKAAEQMAREQERAVKQVCRVIFSGEDKGKAKSFVKWYKFCSAHRAAEARVAADRREAEALRRAAQQVEEAQRAQQGALSGVLQKQGLVLLSNTMRNNNRKRLLSGWLNWKRQVAIAAKVQSAQRLFLDEVTRRCDEGERAMLGVAFKRILKSTAKRQSQNRVVKSVLKKLLRSYEKKGLIAWMAFVHNSQAAEAKRTRCGLVGLSGISALLQQRQMRSIARAWRTWLVGLFHAQLVGRASAAVASAHLALGLHQCTHVVALSEHRRVASAMRHWHYLVLALRECPKCALSAQQERARHLKLLHKCTRRLASEEVACAWALWKSLHQRTLRIRRGCVYAQRFFDEQAQKTALHQWRRTARQLQAVQTLGYRVARSLEQSFKGCLGRAWRMWYSAALKMKALDDHQAMAAAAKADSDARKLRSAGRRIFKAKLGMVWDEWVKATNMILQNEAREASLRSLIVRCARNMTGDVLSKAWRGWREAVVQMKFAEMEQRLLQQERSFQASKCHGLMSTGADISGHILAKRNFKITRRRFEVWHDALKSMRLVRQVLSLLARQPLFAAFQGWLLNSIGKRERLQCAHRCLVRVRRIIHDAQKKSTVRALFKWRGFAWARKLEKEAAAKSHAKTMDKTLKAMAGGLQSQAFRHWLRLMRAAEKAEAIAKQRSLALGTTFRTLRFLQTSAGFRTWKLATEAWIALEAKKANLLDMMVGGKEARQRAAAFRHWSSLAEAAALHEAQQSHVLALVTNSDYRALKSAFSSWLSLAVNFSQRLAALPKLFTRLGATSTKTALMKWRAAARAASENLRLRQHTSSGFALLRVALTGMEQAALARGYRAWKQHNALCSDRIKLVQTRLKELKRLSARLWRFQVSGVLRRWHEIAMRARETKQMARKTLSRVVRHFGTHALTHALGLWRYFIAHQDEARDSDARQERTLRRAMHILGRSNLVRGWRLWCRRTAVLAHLEEEHRSRGNQVASAVTGLGLSLHRNCQGRAFRSWANAVAHAKASEAAQAQSSKVLKRGAAVLARMRVTMSQLASRRMFSKWHYVVVVQARAVKHNCLNLLNMLDNAGLRMSRMAWRRWSEGTALAKKRDNVLRKIARHKVSSDLRTAIGHWRSSARALKEEALLLHVHGNRMLSVLRHLRASALLGAWLRWRAILVRDRDLRRALNRSSRIAKQCLNRAVHASMSSALGTWKTYITSAAALEAANEAKKVHLLKMMLGSVRLQTRTSLSKWKRTSEALAASEQQASLHTTLRNESMKRVASALLSRSLSCAWLTWHHTVTSERRTLSALRTMRVMAAAVHQKALNRALRTWLQYTAAANLAASRAAAAGFLDTHRLLGKVFGAWAKLVDPLVEPPEHRCLRILTSLTAPRVMRAKNKAISTWRTYLRHMEHAAEEAQKRQKVLTRVVVGRLAEKSLSLALAQWKKRVQMRAALQHNLSFALVRLRVLLQSRNSHSLHRSWNSWRAHVAAMARADEKRNAQLRLGLELMSKRGLAIMRSGWLQWKAALVTILAADRLMRRVLNRTTVLAPQQDAWELWQRATVTAAEDARLKSQLEAALAEQGSLHAKNSGAQKAVQTMKLWLSGRLASLTRKGWQSWKHAMSMQRLAEEQEAKQQQAMRIVVLRLKDKKLAAGWHSWRGRHVTLYLRQQQAKGSIRTLSLMVEAWSKGSVGRAFAAWRREITSQQTQEHLSKALRANQMGMSAKCGVSLMERMLTRHSTFNLRSAIDRWFIATHSREANLANGSRALQLLFTVDMRLMQRSLLRWQNLVSPPSSTQHPRSPSPPYSSSYAEEAISPGSYASPIASPRSPIRMLRQRQDEAKLEMGHYRRLLWAHSRTLGGDMTASWQQGRASVLAASQRTVTTLLCRRLLNKTIAKAWAKWLNATFLVAKAVMKGHSQTKAFSAMATILRRRNTQRLAKALHAWSNSTAAASKAQAQATLALEQQTLGLRFFGRWLSRLQLRSTLAAFNRWSGEIASLHQLLNNRERYLGALGNIVSKSDVGKVQRRLVQWRSASVAIKLADDRRRGLLRRATASFARASLQRGMNTWRKALAQMAAEVQMSEQVLSRMASRLQAAALRKWREEVAQVKALEKHAKDQADSTVRVLSLMKSNVEAMALRQWQDYVDATIEEERLAHEESVRVAAALKALECSRINAALNTWKAVVAQDNLYRRVLGDLMGAWRLTTKRVALHMWRRRVSAQVHTSRDFQMAFRVLKRAIGGAEVRSMGRALRLWSRLMLTDALASASASHEADKQARALKTMRNVTGRLQTGVYLTAIGSALNKWCKAIESEAAVAARKMELTRRVQVLLFGGWQRAAMKAVSKWKASIRAIAAEEYQRSLEESLRAAQAHEEAALAAAAVARESALRDRSLRTLYMVASSSAGRTKAQALNSWRAFLNHLKSQDAEKQRLAEQQLRVLQTLSLVVGGQGPKLMGIALITWKKYLEARRREMARCAVMLTQAAGLWTSARQQRVRNALRKWHRSTEAQRLSSQERKRKVLAALELMESMAKRQLQGAWRRWTSTCASMVAAAGVGCVMEMEVRKFKLMQLRRVALASSQKREATAWRKWSLVCYERNFLVQQHKPALRVFTGILENASQSSLQRSFHQWADAYHNWRQRRDAQTSSCQLVLKALGRFSKGRVSKAWRGWQVYMVRQSAAMEASERQAQKQTRVLLSAVSRITGVKLSAAFKAWQLYGARARADDAAGAAKEAGQRAVLEAMGATCGRYQRSVLARMLWKWQLATVLEAVAEGQRVVASDASASKKQLAVRQLQWTFGAALHKKLREALTHWRVSSGTMKSAQRCLAHVVHGRSHRTLAAAFRQWQTQGKTLSRRYEGRKRLGAGAYGILSRWGTKAAARAFRSWVSMTLLSAQRERLVAESLELIRDKALYNLRVVALRNASASKGRAFNVWLAGTNANRQMALSYSLLRLSLRNQCNLARRVILRCLCRAVHQWRLSTSSDLLESELRASVKSMRSMSRAWRNWSNHVWSHRCLVLQERAAFKTLSELRRLHSATYDELNNAKATLRSSHETARASKQQIDGERMSEGGDMQSARGQRQVKKAFKQWAQDVGFRRD